MCGAKFHSCKNEDHLYICPNVTTSCTYYSYGCKEVVARKNLLLHLESHAGEFLSDYPEHPKIKGISIALFKSVDMNVHIL